MRIFWSELRGSAVTKVKGSLRLRKLKVDALTVQRRELADFQCCRSSEVLNLNNSLNIKIRKKFKDFLVPYNINNHQLQ